MLLGGLSNIGQEVQKVHNPLKAVQLCRPLSREEPELQQTGKRLKAQGINAFEMNLLFDSFVDGARVDDYMPDFKTCKDKMFFWWKDYVYMWNFFMGEDDNFQPNIYNMVYNVTATFGELGTWIDSCYDTEQDIAFDFSVTYFTKFASFSMYSLTWVSNLLGRTIDITNRISDIKAAEEICDLETIYY